MIIKKRFKNGYEIFNGPKFIYSQDELSSTLIIDNLTESDNYSITCVLVNTLGRETCDSHLKIKAIPKIDKEPVDQYVDAGENLKFKIPIVGKGPFSFKIKKSGAESADSENRFKFNEIDGILTVTLPSKIQSISFHILQ